MLRRTFLKMLGLAPAVAAVPALTATVDYIHLEYKLGYIITKEEITELEEAGLVTPSGQSGYVIDPQDIAELD